MSRGSGSSIIPVAVFFAILLFVLPVSADNTTTETNITATETTIATTETTIPPAETTVAATQTAVATTQTVAATTQTTAVATETTVAAPPATVITPAQPVTPVEVAATTGSVSVYSSPPGASILIDGIYRGSSPRTVGDLSPGNHILRLTLSGYHDYEGSIYIVAGQTAQGYGTLQPVNQVVSAAPTQTGIVTVFVPVITVTAAPTQDPGLLGNSSVIVAIIGVFTALIAAGVSIFTHVKPPKKE